jgi:hypothetical protein
MLARAEFAVGVEPAALAACAPPPAFVVDPLPGVPELGGSGVAIGGIGGVDGVDGTSTGGGDGSATSGIAGSGTAGTETSGAASGASEPTASLGVAETPAEGSDAEELVGAARPRPSANRDASPIRALFGETRMHTQFPALRHGAVRA